MGKHSVGKDKSSKGLGGTILTIIVIGVICAIIYLATMYYDKITPTNTDNNKTQNQVSVQNKNEKTETAKEETEVKEKKEESEVKEEKNEENKEEKVVEETSISDEEKALELAKKKYGSTDGVYFRIERIVETGVFEISVRDNDTTMEYAWYTVNTKTGTVK